jgi:hypothetical protein
VATIGAWIILPLVRRSNLVRVALRGLDGLSAVFDFGGFGGAAELAEGLGFGGQVADQVRTASAELFFPDGDEASVAGFGFFRLSPLIVHVAETG